MYTNKGHRAQRGVPPPEPAKRSRGPHLSPLTCARLLCLGAVSVGQSGKLLQDHVRQQSQSLAWPRAPSPVSGCAARPGGSSCEAELTSTVTSLPVSLEGCLYARTMAVPGVDGENLQTAGLSVPD